MNFAAKQLVRKMRKDGFAHCAKHVAFFPLKLEEEVQERIARLSEQGHAAPELFVHACPQCSAEASSQIANLLSLATSPAEKAQHRRFRESANVFSRIRTPRYKLINPLKE